MDEKKPTGTEVLNSLTGFDEIAIEKAFGADISQLPMQSLPKFGRALAFVIKRRDGMNHAEAYAAVQGMTRAEVDDLFSDEDEELPGSEAGKDES